MSKNLKMIFSVHTMEVDGVDKGEKYFKFVCLIYILQDHVIFDIIRPFFSA